MLNLLILGQNWEKKSKLSTLVHICSTFLTNPLLSVASKTKNVENLNTQHWGGEVGKV